MADVVECSLDSRVAPAWILASHSDDQVCDDFHDPGPTRRSSLVGPLLGNQLPMPTKDGVWRDDRRDFGEGSSSDGLAPHGQSASLTVGQSESSATELLLQNSVLLVEVLDDRILLAADPASQSGHQDLPGLKNNGHRGIVATPRNNRQLSAGGETG
jgi:hypothetical protein